MGWRTKKNSGEIGPNVPVWVQTISVMYLSTAVERDPESLPTCMSTYDTARPTLSHRNMVSKSRIELELQQTFSNLLYTRIARRTTFLIEISYEYTDDGHDS